MGLLGAVEWPRAHQGAPERETKYKTAKVVKIGCEDKPSGSANYVGLEVKCGRRKGSAPAGKRRDWHCLRRHRHQVIRILSRLVRMVLMLRRGMVKRKGEAMGDGVLFPAGGSTMSSNHVTSRWDVLAVVMIDDARGERRRGRPRSHETYRKVDGIAAAD
nr:hypothetical protein CFP56_16785 [Quercus suber]